MSDKSDLIIDLTTKPNFASTTTPMFMLISEEPATLPGTEKPAALPGIQIEIVTK